VRCVRSASRAAAGRANRGVAPPEAPVRGAPRAGELLPSEIAELEELAELNAAAALAGTGVR